MKVGVVCREHPRHWSGGFAIAAWNTARAARLAGVDVTFITAERPDGFSGVEVVDGVRVVWLMCSYGVLYISDKERNVQEI